MTESKATKLTAQLKTGPTPQPAEPMGVFVKHVFGPFGCYRTGQKVTRQQLGKRWDEFVAARILKVL